MRIPFLDSLKANPVFNFAFRFVLGQPAWSERDYATFSDKGFKRNPVVFKCVETVSKSVGAIPLYLVDKEGEEIEKHPLLDLLKKPNPDCAGAKFVESLTAFRLLAGNSYILAIGPGDEMKPRNPHELWILRPDRMTVVPGMMGVMGYQYSAGGHPKKWVTDPLTGQGPILHWKTFNPTNDLYGMSPLEAALMAVDQHNDASAWNKALLQNSGQPSGAFVVGAQNGVATGQLTDAQYDRLKRQMEDKVQGAKNAGRPMLLEGGLDWKQFSLSPREMDWINGKNISSREIAMVYGTPTQLVGIPGESTYSNYKEARMAFYEETVLPTLDNLLDELNGWLVPMFDDLKGAKLCYDADALPALAPKREMLWSMVKDASFLTMNEKRKQLGFDDLDLPEADEVFIPSGLLPLRGAMEAPATSPEGPQPEPTEEGDGEEPKPEGEAEGEDAEVEKEPMPEGEGEEGGK